MRLNADAFDNQKPFEAVDTDYTYIQENYHVTNGVPTTATGSTFNYIPSNGDNISVALTSSASCASPGTVTGSLTVVVSPTM